MSILRQYKESLKAIEAEEVFDLLIFRPLAFVFVKLTYPINLTPNQVSTTAMIFGVAAGVLFGFGRYDYIILGAIFYFICNVLDCADGQIARLKKNGTKVGRIVDGFIDYIVSTSVFIGIAIGLVTAYAYQGSSLEFNYFNLNNVLYIWLISIMGGLSSALQALYFDLYRNKYLEKVFGKVSNLKEEYREFAEEKEKLEKEGIKIFDRFLIAVYLKYCNLQMKGQVSKAKQTLSVEPKLYVSKNKYLLRLWSLIGSTTHITLCIICAFLNNLELFLIVCIVPMNLLMMLLFYFQKRTDASLTKQTQS